MAGADRLTCPRCGACISADDPSGLCLSCRRSVPGLDACGDLARWFGRTPADASQVGIGSGRLALAAIIVGGLWLTNWRRSPQEAEAMAAIRRGEELAGRNMMDQAIAEFRAAIRLKPDEVWAHNDLGNALSEKGELEEAIAAYREAIRRRSDYAIAHYNLGRARRQGNLAEAIAENRAAIRLRPEDAAAHLNLGEALHEQGKLDEAITEYRASIGLRHDLAEAHNNLGIILAGQGKLDEAIAEHRTAIRFQPDDAQSHNNLGVALCRPAKMGGGSRRISRGNPTRAQLRRGLLQPRPRPWCPGEVRGGQRRIPQGARQSPARLETGRAQRACTGHV